MNQETILASAAIIIGFVMVFLTGFTWIQQDRTAWPWSFRALLTSATVWLMAYAFDFVSSSVSDKILLAKIQYLGISTLPVFWFFFSLYFVNQSQRLTRSLIFSALIIPVITTLLASTNEAHRLIWARTSLLTDNGIAYLSSEYGLWFWVHTAYSYVLLLAGTLFMMAGVFRYSGRARWQALILTLAVAFPWIANVIFLSGLNPVPAVDWTPFAGALSCVGFMIAIFGFDSLPWTTPDGEVSV
ncbi:MAG: hypothetical protein DWQ07_24135 [Chloroflexi bacterium]|nr:MAG: hypothetical protein DWQ07_24135 [Chloroflexota bacterium]MBL1196223.1 hypothetical protein [Chloroflexota bacterium]NOH13517.1 hypothetical protein [Chloroflexota bacterium]